MKTETKHSPGPWSVHGDDTREVYYIHGANAICDMRRDTRFYCSPAEREANAKLIAAAPELLEALDACVNLLWVCEFELCPHPEEIDQGVIDAAKAVIAKVKS